MRTGSRTDADSHSSRTMTLADAMQSGIRPARVSYGDAFVNASRFIRELGPAAPRRTPQRLKKESGSRRYDPATPAEAGDQRDCISSGLWGIVFGNHSPMAGERDSAHRR